VIFLAFLQLIRSAVAGGNAHRQRRRLAPNESIHRYLRQENEAGNMRPKFTLAAMKVDDDEDVSEYSYDIDLVQANQAVTRSTTYSTDDGGPYPIGDLGVKFLVQDRSSFGEDEGIAYNVGAKPTTFALISVDENTETVNGIVKKKGDKAMNIQQLSGSNVIATPADDFVPPKDFICQVTQEHHHNDHRKGERTRVRHKGGKARGVRRTLEDEGVLIEEHLNEHHEHHHEHNHHDHNHDHVFSEDDIDNLINDISSNHHQKHHKHRRAAGFPATPSHQVDLFIEIDQEFVTKNGIENGTDLTNRTTAFRYVNTLVTAASTIFEAEVDTRLTVAHIKLTDNYADMTDSRSALDRMREIYRNSSEWHHTDGNGNGVDLYHAILGKRLNGGIAFVGSVCSPDTGYGISPNMRGNFVSLDFATVWDTSVLSHEIGHSFGALHTFDRRVDSGGFKPPVDRCFIRSSDSSTCPPEAELEGAATLMSYCDLCPRADVKSLAYTFGGNFVEGDPNDIDAWRNNPSLVGSFNNDPKRVPKTMYDHISSRNCTQPNFTCEEDSDCFDWRRCTIDKCNKLSGQCEHTAREDCCGNGVCEPNELPCGYGVCVPNDRTCDEDCGPFNLETRSCDGCNARRGRGNGIMFDMQSVLSSDSLLINTIEFRHTQTQFSTVTIYTAEGSFTSKATTPEAWMVANSTEIKIGGKKGGYATVEFKVPIAINSGSIRSFYIASTGKLISGHHEEGVDHLAIDNTLSIKYPARIVGYPFGGGLKGSWDGKVNYSVYPNNRPSIFNN